MHLNKGSNLINSTVLIFPAQTLLLEDKELFFLFSIRQVVTVFEQSCITYGPDKSDRICGTAQFRGNDLPVLSLEKCLGLPLSDNNSTMSVVAIREVYKEPSHEFKEVYALCKLSAAMRKLQLPLECRPVLPPQIMAPASFLKGAYETKKTIFLVVHLGQILEALAVSEQEAVH